MSRFTKPAGTGEISSTLGAGSITALIGYHVNPFRANRSRLLFALVVGVSVGAVGALYFSTVTL